MKTPVWSTWRKVLLNFFRNESCGKCTPCRIGTQRAYQILDRHLRRHRQPEGPGRPAEPEPRTWYELSNCGLGQTAGVPIRDILKYFRAEVEAHIRLKVCPTGVCPMSGQLALSLPRNLDSSPIERGLIMVNLTIDGNKYEVPEGTTVLQAARLAGIEIPTLCDHKTLTPLRRLPPVPGRGRRRPHPAAFLHPAGQQQHGRPHRHAQGQAKPASSS